LAQAAVGHLIFVDGDVLEVENLPRHVLPVDYVGQNKAAALALHLDENVDGVRVEALPRDVDRSLSDDDLDNLLRDADLLVAATDNREVQRRLGRRALALDLPAVFPALYESGGGEVFVQLLPGVPCFMCWDAFRPPEQQLRGVSALNVEILSLVQLAVYLSLGALDRHSEFARLLASAHPGHSAQQLFILTEAFAPLATPLVRQRIGCPSCRVGPSPLLEGLGPLQPDDVVSGQVGHTIPGEAAPGHQRDPDPAPSEAPWLPAGLFVLAALAFLAGPFIVMGPLGGYAYMNEENQSFGHVLMNFVVGWGCFAWFLAGLAAVGFAVLNFLATLFGRDN
jgi:hypothetical protein